MLPKNVWLGAATASIPFAVLLGACANDDAMIVIGDDCDGSCAPSNEFTSDAGTKAETGADAVSEAPLLCKGTECQAPWATCASSIYKCGTNLQTDRNNCGACDNACPSFDPLHLASRCTSGACVLECTYDSEAVHYKDCNDFLDDGCEINIGGDPNNCGACGRKCAEGDICIEGRCGCADDKVLCTVFGHGGTGTTCVDLKTDDAHCGECGHPCYPPTDACETLPPHSNYGCMNAGCGQLKCSAKEWADCDGDLPLECASNGCETNITEDPDNCGRCGNKCGPDQECRDDGLGRQCYDKCNKPGQALCDDGCFDLLSDRTHCGDCDTTCDAMANQIPQCVRGICEFRCAAGWADCDGNPSNGCEVDISNNQTNCGGCGISCDVVAGQPCVEGKCLMVECDAGPVTK